MKAFLHIGTEKTGTTTIQSFLFNNRNKLGKKGIHVLTAAGRGNGRALPSYAMRHIRFDNFHSMHGISTSLQRKSFDQKIEDDVSCEIDSFGGCDSVVISSEHFHSRCMFIDEIEKIKYFLDRFFDDIYVIVYLRPQVDMATSKYTTRLRGKCSLEFKDFVFSDCVPEKYYYNYKKILDNWKTVFGKRYIIPRVFDSDRFLNGNLIDDYLKLLGTDRSGLNEVLNKNESVTPFGQEILRLNNEFSYNFKVDKDIDFYHLVKKNVVGLHQGKGMSLSSSDARKVQSKFDLINHEVAVEWFGRDVLFDIDYKNYADGRYLSDNEKDMLRLLFSFQAEIKNNNCFLKDVSNDF
uniref:hypothetical protein n=1 Tax=Halomonas sp. TaxID=1486246 RepID=UPI0026156E54|nr:hypothetical protein [Halomonas sp.]